MSSEQTEDLAAQLGALLRGGECIELVADLGGGKTTFTRGLVRGAGSNDVVASPTYTISKVYEAPTFVLHHFDFYRLTQPGLMRYELQEVAADPRAILIVEWGDVVADILPPERLRISIKPTSESVRELICTYSDQYKHIMDAL